jgi:hypothetical protein
MIKCSLDTCKNSFSPKTHNQKYCSNECCRVATNLKIKNKYYENKERLRGKKRVCKTNGCKTLLSRYNENSMCEKCESNKDQAKRGEILRMINDNSKII